MKTAATRATEKDLAPVILTVDTLMGLVERVGALERQNEQLKELITNNYNSVSGDLAEAVNNLYKDCTPDIAPDGRLVFKAYNNIADPVQAFVQAEIVESSDRGQQ